jgi:transposase
MRLRRRWPLADVTTKVAQRGRSTTIPPGQPVRICGEPSQAVKRTLGSAARTPQRTGMHARDRTAVQIAGRDPSAMRTSVRTSMERRWLTERLEAGASYEAIARDAGCSPSKVAWWAKRHGLASAHAERHAARGPIEREELAALVAEHLSIREIAARLNRSPSTVRHWLGKHGLETLPNQHSAAARRAAERGDEEAELYCRVHGMTRHVRRDAGFRCATCRIADVTERRRRVKRILLREAGGACVLCGYDRCVAALHFHHVDPAHKSFGVAGRGMTRSLNAAGPKRESASCCARTATPKSRAACRIFL